MDYASAIAHGRVSQLSTYTAPCLRQVVHLEEFAVVTESLMQCSRFELDGLSNGEGGRSMSRQVFTCTRARELCELAKSTRMDAKTPWRANHFPPNLPRGLRKRNFTIPYLYAVGVFSPFILTYMR